MGAPPIADRVPVEEYLASPAHEHFEYVDGQLVELHLGGKPHAKIQARLTHMLLSYAAHHPGGYVATELRCRLKIGGRFRFRLPDLAVVLNDQSSEQRFLDRAPDLVVEIRSPEDSFAGLMRKMEEYLANGARLGWLVLPEERSVVVLTQGRLIRTVVSGETLDGAELFPELQIPIDDLFS